MKPAYESFSAPAPSGVDDARRKLKTYGALASSAPAIENLNVEKTYKMYVGGKQARPDTSNSKPVYYQDSKSGENKVYALVSDASRKDVRNAVEAANAAFKG